MIIYIYCYMYILYDYYIYNIICIYYMIYIYIEILRIDMIGYDSLWYYMIYEGELANFAPPFARFWTSNPAAMVEGQNWVPPSDFTILSMINGNSRILKWRYCTI